MKLKEFLKSELNGWTNFELAGLIFALLVVLISAIILKDNPIAVISAICGILYTIIAGKGKISCYIFGLTGSSCYSYLSLINGLYGNLLLYAFYYIPMQILGIFKWKKNLNKKNHEIIKTNLTRKELFTAIGITIVAISVTIYILNLYHDNNPIFDGITSILSVLGMYLTVKRCIEQWIVWMIVNGLSLIMWLNIVLQGKKVYATVFMWAVYLFLAVYFYIKWKKSPEFSK